MTISEAIIEIERLTEKDKEQGRKVEAMRSNLIKTGKKKYLITVAWPQAILRIDSWEVSAFEADHYNIALSSVLEILGYFLVKPSLFEKTGLLLTNQIFNIVPFEGGVSR